MVRTPQRPVCDYEGSDYRTRFWAGKGRDYEDLVERIALRRLLPPFGSRLIDIGAGFGRLADEYDGYDHVVLFDYSRTLLREAQERLGDDPRYVYVAGNWYQMPFVPGSFDALVQIRTMHHAADVPALLRQLARIAAPGAKYILEFANKRNLKAIARYLLKRQQWSPFAPQPIEFVDLNFDFHPRWMREQLLRAGFQPNTQLAVSYFRVGILKKLAPIGLLAALDRLLQPTGRWLQLSPSVFVASRSPGVAPRTSSELFACPECQTRLDPPPQGHLKCGGCGRLWRLNDGIYDFKEPGA
ncbi:MAG TPA: class I SAM-dependent methyltransferase [Candidatus Binatia bacterium]|nr:class I SAM-dependent methyltransferase [Candidatus Binatia bacterium]